MKILISPFLIFNLDYNYFCRFAQRTCSCCGRKGVPTTNYCRHLEKKCPTFSKHIKVRVKANKLKKQTSTSTWLFAFVSTQHLDRAFAVSREYSTQLMQQQFDIRLAEAENVKRKDMERIEENQEKGLFLLFEDKQQEKEKGGEDDTAVDAANGNPFNWNIDRLLEFVDSNKVRRAPKRKQQAEIVQEYIKRSIEKEYKLESGKVAKTFTEIVGSFKELQKKQKWALESRFEQAKLNYNKRINLR